MVWSFFVLQTWYQHPMSNQQCQDVVVIYLSICRVAVIILAFIVATRRNIRSVVVSEHFMLFVSVVS